MGMGLKSTSTWGDGGEERDLLPAQTGLPLTEGLYTGTRVATQIGWRPVEAVVPGDRVLTFDFGLQPVHAVLRAPMIAARPDESAECPPYHWPLQVPVAALGNRLPLLLAPEQMVVLESDRAEQVYGDPFVLVPAAALEGWRGIVPVPPPRGAELITLGFEKAQIVHGIGALLYHCPGGYGPEGSWLDELLDAAPPTATALGLEEACGLVDELIALDEARGPAQAALETGAKRP